ncbi:hypothetical protein [Streptomyces jumonjinensis]|uniref:Uncharacterized protein n=1 Tax=Streptomyces jumonjinensis TaxID=1945 RepID=A0A646KP69_STRJU|nr:hypothetical protein [Streptomyces jumonjinensis]MQT04124.1 hypothetical protein [Streptomyces jumonjinensis]
MPIWITPRRLGATAVLYAVFVGGWYLGQPLAHVGCTTSEPATAAEDPAMIGEPGDVLGDLSRAAGVIEVVVTYRAVSTGTIVPCDSAPRPRLLAWVIGDWR